MIKKNKNEKDIGSCCLGKSLFEVLPYFIWMKDLDGNYLYVNDYYARICGFKKDQIIGKNDKSIWPKEIALKFSANDNKVIKEKKAYNFFETAIIGGQEITVETFKAPMYDESGKLIGTSGMARDVSEALENKKLRDLEKTLDYELNKTTDLKSALTLILRMVFKETIFKAGGFYIVNKEDSSLKLIYTEGLPEKFKEKFSFYEKDSPQAKLVFSGQTIYGLGQESGLSINSLLLDAGFKNLVILPIKNKDQIVACLNLTSKGKEYLRAEDKKYLEMMIEKLGPIIARFLDVAELQENKLRLDSILQNSSEAIFVAQDGFLKFFNSKTKNVLGLDEKIIKSTPFANFVYEEDRGLVEQDYIKKLKGDNAPSRYFFRFYRGQELRWAQINSVSFYWEGKPAVLSFAFDVTEEREYEKIIEEKEKTFQVLFSNMKDAGAIYEPTEDGEDFIIKNFNQAAEEIEKVRHQDIIGKRLTEVFPGVKDFGLFDVLKRVLRTGLSESFPIGFYKDQRISGWRENYVIKLLGKEVACIYQDKTKEKIFEKDLEMRDKVLLTLNDYSKIFLTERDFVKILPNLLKNLNQILSVDYSFVFFNYLNEKGELEADNICFKTSEEGKVINNFTYSINYNHLGLGRWVDDFSHNRIIFGLVEDFSGPEKFFLQKQKITSILMIPIFAFGKWWGYIGFGYKEEKKLWSEAEINALQAAVNMIEGAIERQENDKKIREQVEKLEKINNLMVGRELKMVELKDRLKKLGEKV